MDERVTARIHAAFREIDMATEIAETALDSRRERLRQLLSVLHDLTVDSSPRPQQSPETGG